MSEAAFLRWLDAYGAAWERRDADAFAALFADDARYHWTPFQDPQRGPSEIRAAFAAATERQRAPRFAHEVIAVRGGVGWAKWSCGLTRAETGAPVRIDGILSAKLDADGRCSEFREWWHSDETVTTLVAEAADV